MVTIETIQNKVNTAKLFFQVLTDKYTSKLKKGCDEKPDSYDCLNWLISALSGDVDNNFNTDKTQTLYGRLCTVLGGYSESYTVDPDAYVPNITVNETGGTNKPPIYITDADFVGNTYTNASLAGDNSFAVFDQNVNRYLINGTEFTYNASGGIIILNGIYGGEQFVLIF